jgi:hypothetical protein
VPETLLHTKLYIQPLRPNLVPQSRLFDGFTQSLDQGSKMTLISAPAAFSKINRQIGDV